MTEMIEQIFSITRVEGALLLLSAALLLQFLYFRAGVVQTMNKQRKKPAFPGLMAALADIPARAEQRAKHQKD